MQESARTTEQRAGFGLIVLAAGATLVLLQAYRVFVPYLVFEVDQSEREKLARIAVTVFGLTFLGALLYRLLGGRITFWVAAVALITGRLGIQFSEDPGLRWMLGAATVIAGFWLLIVLLPQPGEGVSTGIGFAFAIDLLMRGLRDTLDLPWMPGTLANVSTLVIVVAVALSGYTFAKSNIIETKESPFRPSLRYVGIGSGFALWLLAAGNPGFSGQRSELELAGAFALIAVGTVLALWFVCFGSGRILDGNDGSPFAAGLGALGVLSIVAWTYGDSRWLALCTIPVFSFLVVVLTMRSAAEVGPEVVPGRWRSGSVLTIGLLLQTAFIFLYFARSGPMELLIAPIVVLSISNLAGRSETPRYIPNQRVLKSSIAAAGAVATAVVLLLARDVSPSGISAEVEDLRVMTYNIQEGFSRENIWSLEETARTIEAQDPDIVLLQEITRGWLVMSSVDEVRWLADRLDMNYIYSGNSYDGLWGNAILSRFPIESEDSVIFSTTKNLRRGAVSIDVATPNGPLRIIGTHLDNLGTGTQVRGEQVQELLDFWGGTTPALIAGDFNSDPGSPEWQAMVDAGFTDAAGDDATTTSEDERRIDYVWVSPGIEVTDYTVPDIWTSDHRPVVVSLSVQP